MKTLAIVNQKGGAGKTTLALNVAAALVELDRRILVVDADQQRSAIRWSDQRSGETRVPVQPLPVGDDREVARFSTELGRLAVSDVLP